MMIVMMLMIMMMMGILTDLAFLYRELVLVKKGKKETNHRY